MTAVRRLRARGATDESDDSGLTLVELVVAMSIFTIVLGIYFSALISMSHTTVRAQNTVDAADALRATFNSFDHQVRYATSINYPGTGTSGSYYIEFEATNLPDAQPPLCYQWRYNPTSHELAYRTWTQDGVSPVTAWHGIAWDVVSPGGGSPFVLKPASGSVVRQSMTVRLRVDGPNSTVLADQGTTFVARNSSFQSLSNADTNGDGASDAPVCMTGMDRP